MTTDAPAPIDVCVLGSLELSVEGRSVDVSAPKQRSLLLRLLLERGQVVSVDELIGVIWNGDAPATAVKSVQVLVGRVRAALLAHDGSGTRATPAVVFEHGGYRLDAASFADSRSVFDASLASGRRAVAAAQWSDGVAALESALACWRGAALGELADASWARGAAARLEESRLDAVELLLRCEIELGQRGCVVSRLHELIDAHPARESLRVLLMRALHRRGERTEALAAYDAARTYLHDHLGVEPGVELEQLRKRLDGLDPSDGSCRLSSSLAQRASAPVPRTSFVGRASDLAGLRLKIVDPDIRLLTITGWGGTGKTRVAIELIRSCEPEFEDAIFVDLSAVSGARQIPTMLLRALGVSAVEGDPLQAACASIARRRALIVIDNFEHVLDGAPIVEQIISQCANAMVLVTSRASLNIDAEHVVPLEPLPLATDTWFSEPSRTTIGPAVELFLQRMEAVGGAAIVDAVQLRAIADICARVDGLPLGIELAAARTRLLKPTEILSKLDRRLDLLTSTAVDVTDRQRSLRATIEWSYDLLDVDEQRLLHQLSIFRDGCALEVAAELMTFGPSARRSVEERVDSLVSKGLVRSVDRGGSVRVTMLETIAEFARERLADDEFEVDARRRHAAWCRNIARLSGGFTLSAEDVAARDLLRAELPTVLDAFEWLLDHDIDGAAMLVRDLQEFQFTDWSDAEYCDLAERILERISSVSDELAGHVHLSHARALARLGREDQAHRSIATAMELFKRFDDWAGTAAAYHVSGDISMNVGSVRSARRASGEAIVIGGSIGDVRVQAMAWNVIGRADVFDARFEAAMLAHERSRDLSASVGDFVWRTLAHENIGTVLMRQGLPRQAARCYEEALALHLQQGHATSVLRTTCNLARLNLEIPDPSASLRWSELAAQQAKRAGNRILHCFALSNQAVALQELGRVDAAEECARRAVSAAIDVQWYYVVMYPMAVLAGAATDRGDARASAQLWSLVDEHELLEDTRLDRATKDRRTAELLRLRTELGDDHIDAIEAEVSGFSAQRRAQRAHVVALFRTEGSVRH